MTDRPDKALRRLTGYCLKRATAAAGSAAAEILRGFGLRRTTFSALSVIAGTPGLSQAQLAEALAIERPNIVPILGELESLGLVRRARSSEDRRAYRLFATLSGQVLFTGAFARLESADRALTEGLTPHERRVLMRALDRIEANAGAAPGEDRQTGSDDRL